MITTGERQHGAAPGRRAYQLQCRFHGIGTGRAAELDFRFSREGRWQQAEQVLDELILDRRGQVEGMQWQFIGQYLLDRFDHHRVVMPQRQRAGPGEAVDERAPFNVFDIQAFGALQCQWNASWIAARVGLLPGLTSQQWRFIELVQRFGRRRGNPGRRLFDKAGGD
ncbi:hypothetical protein D3C81_1599620 [compost metagenome]